MANFCIITNNPAAAADYADIAKFYKTDVAGIFQTVRDEVHLGAKLISHPLAGSVKPNENPYKSVMLSTRRGPHDADSLRLIEDAVAVLRKLPVKNRDYSARVLDDFIAIDSDLLASGMAALPAEYHR